MDRQELAKRLMATYLEELHEHVEAMNRDLLALEKGLPDEQRGEIMKVLFRSAHSLKGASRAVSVDVIEEACHIMEDILADVRANKRTLTQGLYSLFFKVADAIQEVGMRLRDDQEIIDTGLHALIPKLRIAASDREAPEHELDDQPANPTVDSSLLDETSIETPQGTTAEKTRTLTAAPSSEQVQPDVRAESVAVATSTGTASVRVAAEKLDALLSQNGELLVARRRINQRAVEASAFSESLAELHGAWNEWSKPLQKLLVDKTDELSAATLKDKLPRRAIAIMQRTTEQLTRLEKEAERLAANMAADSRVLGHTCDALNDEVYRVRMLPFAEACGALDRAVRDIAQATGKKVDLVIQGEDVEVDRSVLEGLKDPLLHLVRNSVDHGVESPADRQSKGKPPNARITVSAELCGGLIEVVVADDGRGFDLPRIRELAKQRGLAVPVDEADQARLVFLPGFSTASTVSDVSGRGVGLDVVVSSVEALHGTVDVKFTPGGGSRFTLSVPLTLTTVRCLLATAAERTYAIATSAVQQLVRFDPATIAKFSGRDVLLLGGTPTPLTALSEVLGQGKYQSSSENAKMLAVVVGVNDQRVALVVDELCAEQEVLVKSLGSRIRFARHISGATLLPSGGVALVLNASNVVATALGNKLYHHAAIERPKAETRRKQRLLAVDDSLTTRTLMKSILEGAGYEVVAAVDGVHAWELLTHTDVDLVVSDVDMPRMDGFTLTDKIRKSKKHGELPVILVTARGSDEDKTRGVRVGASAYLVKSGFDQSNLLKSIEQFI